MRRSARLAEKQAKSENEFQREPISKKKRSNNKISAVATLDNGTMVEAFKFLNYCQLATNSLVTKKFWDVIQTHRHSLPLLYVRSINMDTYYIFPAPVKIFDKALSAEAYNEWIIRSNYSKRVPFEGQVATTKSTPNGFLLSAYANYKDLNHRERNLGTSVFFAQVELSDENWPAFQHFVRLTTDPFIYIQHVRLAYQNVVLNLLTGTMNSDYVRLQCKELTFRPGVKGQKFITWIKNHVRCNKFLIRDEDDLNQDGAFLDFFLTGGYCTPSIDVGYLNISKVVVDFVENFLALVNGNEYHCVQSIESDQFVENQDIQVLKNNYGKFVVKEEHNQDDECT